MNTRPPPPIQTLTDISDSSIPTKFGVKYHLVFTMKMSILTVRCSLKKKTIDIMGKTHIGFCYLSHIRKETLGSANADASSRVRGKNFGRRLDLHPYVLYTRSETARIRRLVLTSVVRLCDTCKCLY